MSSYSPPKPADYTNHLDYVLAAKLYERRRTMTPAQIASEMADGELLSLLLTHDGKGVEAKRLALEQIIKRAHDRGGWFPTRLPSAP